MAAEVSTSVGGKVWLRSTMSTRLMEFSPEEAEWLANQLLAAAKMARALGGQED